jgi:hypothetical protein
LRQFTNYNFLFFFIFCPTGIYLDGECSTAGSGQSDRAKHENWVRQLVVDVAGLGVAKGFGRTRREEGERGLEVDLCAKPPRGADLFLAIWGPVTQRRDAGVMAIRLVRLTVFEWADS